MFFELSKLLNLFISPISWIILLLIGIIIFKKKIYRRICIIACILVFLLFTNNLLVDYVKYQSVKAYSTAHIDTTQHYKVAIVMGGFASINKETKQLRYESDRADRLWEAVRLWRIGQVERILITGDSTSFIQEDGTSTTELFLRYMEEMGVPETTFILEQKARNTRENATYTAEILKRENITDKECLLITSATHIERSLKCFAKVGLHPDYYAVNIYDAPTNINHRSFYPSWDAAVKWQELMNEWIGDIAYKIMGYV